MKRKLQRGRASLVILCLASALSSCAARTENQTAASDKQSAAERIATADKFYAQRQDLAQVRQGITLLKQALTEDYSNYDAAWRLAKFNYYLGAHTKNADERERAYKDGIEAGKKAIKLQNDKPEGHFWLGANYGGRAQTSTLTGLSAIDDIKREMETVIKMDEGFQAGSAYMALGQVYLEAPGIWGGDKQKAIEKLEKGLKFGPNNSLLRLNLAKAYIKAKRPEDARKQLDALMNLTPDPDYLPEHQDAIAEARKLLANNLKDDEE